MVYETRHNETTCRLVARTVAVGVQVTGHYQGVLYEGTGMLAWSFLVSTTTATTGSGQKSIPFLSLSFVSTSLEHWFRPDASELICILINRDSY
jgi:hypothetical protein